MWWYGWLQFEFWILEDAIRLGGSVTLAMSEWKLYWIEKPDEKVWSSVSCMASAWMTVLGLEVESETGQITSVQCEECDYQLKCNSLLREWWAEICKGTGAWKDATEDIKERDFTKDSSNKSK